MMPGGKSSGAASVAEVEAWLRWWQHQLQLFCSGGSRVSVEEMQILLGIGNRETLSSAVRCKSSGAGVREP